MDGGSEMAVIERLRSRVGLRAGVAVGIGDDAAVLADDPPTVVTTDLLVEGVHFRRSTIGMGDLGHRALAVNLSDVAAMGARPVAAVVGLGLPRRAPIPDGPAAHRETGIAPLRSANSLSWPTGDDLDALYDGMEALAARAGVSVAGGDVVDAPAMVLAVTAIGRMDEGVAPLLRSGAGAGDLICVTGALGASAAGLLLLEDPLLATGVPEADLLRAAHRRPEPRLAAGPAVAAGGASAMLDCSDGLALDAARMARASGVRIELDLDRLPIAAGVARVAAAAGRDAQVLAATGGEDFELIVAVPPGLLEDMRAALDLPLTPVGRVLAGEPGLTALRAGKPVPLPRLGWEHGG